MEEEKQNKENVEKGNEQEVKDEAQEEVQEACKEEEKKEPSIEEQLAELQGKYLLLRADFDNYRKRMAREANETRERAKINVVSDFLPVYDYFMMAMSHSEQSEDFGSLKQGMMMILSEFKRAFDNLGMQEIDTKGKAFDPQLHDAAKTEPSDTVPEGMILTQWKAGYKIGERLVRPSMVVVSSGPVKVEESHEAESSEEK